MTPYILAIMIPLCLVFALAVGVFLTDTVSNAADWVHDELRRARADRARNKRLAVRFWRDKE